MATRSARRRVVMSDVARKLFGCHEDRGNRPC
jgi:hypothetical protein